MKHIKLLLIALLSFATFGYGQTSDLIISEYGEGTPGNAKYIEIYNGTGAVVNLVDYELWRVSNGGTWPEATYNFTSLTLADGATIVVANNATNTPGADEYNNFCSWNGNDAVGLVKLGVLIDAVGTDGANPGTGWPVAGTTNATVDHTLTRKSTVCDPNTNWTTSAGTNPTDSEWVVTSYGNGPANSGHTVSCAPVCSSTVTWNGTVWDNGTGPTASENAIIDGAYNTSTSSFSACSLSITSSGVLTISGNSFVEVINDIDNAGQIIIADEGSLVQVDEFAAFTNSSVLATPVTVARRTSPLAPGAWYEYTYWSSPVPEATLETLLPNTNPARKFSFNASQFYDNQAEIFNTGTFNVGFQDDIDDDANAWQYASGVMAPATGYAATLSPTDLAVPGGGVTGIIKNFEGNTLNTGNYDVTVNRNDLSSADNNWNLIGNPYPSAIDVSLFFAENQQGLSPSGVLDGSIYLWSHSTPPSATTSGNEQLNFDVSDYAIINLSANTAGEDGLTPNNTIASGQGFFVLFSESAATATGTVRFTNSMRLTADNQQFYRTNNSEQDNKLWLNLTSDNGVFSQLAIAYVDGATNGDDGASYDARRFYSGASAMLVSYAENSTIPLAIQGKQTDALDSNEVISLGLKTGITSPTIYSISIDHFQGEFLSNNAIYLKDNLLNTYQDLTLGDYSFSSEMGDFTTRFEIVFTQPSLGIEEQVLATNSLSIIETQNDNVTFKLNNSNRTIKQVKIFDALGRVVYSLIGNSSTETYKLSNLNQTTYIAQIELDNGMLISKKAIKK